MEDHIRVVAFNGEDWREKIIPNTLEAMKEIVKCHTIQHIGPCEYFAGFKVHIWCDDEGKLPHSDQKAVAGLFVRADGRIVDILCGRVVLTQIDYELEEPDTCGLFNEEARMILMTLLPSERLDQEIREWIYDNLLAYSDKSWTIPEKIMIINC